MISMQEKVCVMFHFHCSTEDLRILASISSLNVLFVYRVVQASPFLMLTKKSLKK